MAFQLSCRNIRLSDDQVLQAEAANKRGQWIASSLPLNLFLGNINGKFEWGKQAFGSTARSIRLEDGGQKLSAELRNGSGGWTAATVSLTEIVTNDDGVLRALVPIVVNYPAEQAPVVVDKILEQLKANTDLAVTMINTSEDHAKAFVIHPQDRSVKGPGDVEAFPVVKTTEAAIIDELRNQVQALPNIFNSEGFTLVTNSSEGQLEAFSKDARASQLDSGNVALTGAAQFSSTGFTQGGFSFAPGISIDTKAGFKGFGTSGQPQMDLSHMLQT